MTQAHTNPPASGTASAQVVDLADATTDPLLKLVLQQLDDDQAQEVVTIDLEGKSSIADHMVIASGRSTRQVAAMAQKLAEKVKPVSARSSWKACLRRTGCCSMRAMSSFTCSAPKCAASTISNACGRSAMRPRWLAPPEAPRPPVNHAVAEGSIACSSTLLPGAR